jgi:hypothetical protein
MLEITASGWLSVDPWKESRIHIDGGQVPVVCTSLWCDVKDSAGVWIYLVAARPTAGAVLSDLRKDDRITVSGEAMALKVHKDDGKSFVELVIYSIVPWRHMTEADQGLTVH